MSVGGHVSFLSGLFITTVIRAVRWFMRKPPGDGPRWSYMDSDVSMDPWFKVNSCLTFL